MSDYISVADVESLIGDTDFSTTTTPTEAEVLGFIELVEAELNARLYQLGFEVPITATQSKKLCEQCVLWGAGALTLEAMTALGRDDVDESRLNRWWSFFERATSLILTQGGEVLYDADKETDPAINVLPTLFGDDTTEVIDTRLRFRQLAAKKQYEDDLDVSRIYASWKHALSKV